MDLALSPEDSDFRDILREFLLDKIPPEIAEKGRRNIPFSPADSMACQAILGKNGYGAMNWPSEYGGGDATPLHQYIFTNELIAANWPRQSPYGLRMIGPIIMKYGTNEQKMRYLPGIIHGKDWWTQGFSETGAGSDLTSLKTRAVLKGDNYLLNGHKIWTSTAHEANLMFALVRTADEGRPQEGITFLIIPMDLPGITVQPIIGIDLAHSLNQVFFDDVLVPASGRIGDENSGWSYAKFLLINERVGIADIQRTRKRILQLRKLSSVEKTPTGPLIADQVFSSKLADVEGDLLLLEYSMIRLLDPSRYGSKLPNALGLKIRGSEIGQRVTELAVEALGPTALPYEPNNWELDELPSDRELTRGVMQTYLHYRAASIYGGTTEVLKNMMAKQLLG